MKIITNLLLYIIFLTLTPANSLAGVLIQSRIDNSLWKTSPAIYPLKGQEITLKVKKIPAAQIRWFQIIPDISKIYKNANHPWEANPYKWVGFGKIDYFKKELAEFQGQWEIEPFKSNASDTADKSPGIYEKALSWFRTKVSLPQSEPDSAFYNENVGSFWFQVEIEKNGKIEKSPCIEDSDQRGLSPKVFRVSIRDGEGFAGYLTSFFNVPGLFGSIPYQSRNYIGADCADILMAAYCQWKNISNTKDYNVAMLVSKFPKVAESDLRNGISDKAIHWGRDIQPGDFIAVRYEGREQYQHIGALFSDANQNNLLDGDDKVLHAGPFPLHYSYLKEGCFDGHIVILRP